MRTLLFNSKTFKEPLFWLAAIKYFPSLLRSFTSALPFPGIPGSTVKVFFPGSTFFKSSKQRKACEEQ
jgi:hypothetical protein